MGAPVSFIKPSTRIASFKPYFFAVLTDKINQLKTQNVDIIRLDMGSPDLPPNDFIVDVLTKNARRPDAHGYTPMGGTNNYRQAIATYYQNRFQVKLDPMRETLGLIGSKEGLFNLSQVLLNPGDVSLVPDPGYPAYTSGGIIAGAEIFYLPLRKENKFLPDLDSIPSEILKRARLLFLNYPNNPTGAIAPIEFFQKAIEFGRSHNIVIAHDAPYVDICFDGYIAPSILQVPGAKEVAVEFNSLSKAYNMGGWRLGMVVGNPQVIGFLHTYKSQMDTSHFGPMMDAGVAALTGDQTWLEERNDIYRYRRDIVLSGLRKAGFSADTPPAAIYVWAQLPAGQTDSMDFCDRMLREIGVSTTPGIVFGNSGEGYIRISLGIATDRVKVAMDRIVNWLK
ncbi:MAG TPA: aminotransferase class I/II-fold pyridoxal phosphate-dependent enzyme [Anaerolineaceae bacterium]|nr:aminotransferase class I/II-fold pyridoxal phosphate-dependent enzyme [Anaerolineaceae bacterium]